MKVLENESLSKYTTVKIGGTAKKVYIPESLNELQELIAKEKPEYYISGGSNLLIAEREFDKVVILRYFQPTLEDLGEGRFRVGASVRLQTLINEINKAGYGGIEYLYSVPGCVGGAVVMNAGRGRKFNKCLSDYIKEVYVLKDNKLMRFDKSECGFAYRNSIFKNSNEYVVVVVVVEVIFEFPEQSFAESLRLKNERIALCKSVQDNSHPNFGTVFMEANSTIMKLVQKLHFHFGGVCFSRKTKNWLLSNHGEFKDAMKLIKLVQILHKMIGKRAVSEVIIWK